MAGQDFSAALMQKSLRTVKSELAFLADTGAITADTLRSILQSLPDQPSLTKTVESHMSNLNISSPPARAQSPANGYQPYSEKQQMQQQQQHQAPPPAYPASNNGAPALCHAIANYAYKASDEGDLTLAVNDRIIVTEYMNAEWWKGRSERTGQEGIFPRAYVRTEEIIPSAPAANTQGSNYGNMPLDVSQSGGQQAQGQPGQPGKGAEMGKKFGKKLGNAAIFGAGATIGSNIVNGIF